MFGQRGEDREVLRDIANRCRTIALAVGGLDRERILGYARELERKAAEAEEGEPAKLASGRGRPRLL